MKVFLWLQKPPRVQWVLKITDSSPTHTVTVRTWLNEYGPDVVPPPSAVTPLAVACARLALTALTEAVDDAKFQLEVKARR